MRKNAIVTGATGFLGRNLIDTLILDGWNILAFHRKSSDLSRLKDCKVETKAVDLYSLDSVMDAVPEGVDAIFHVAGNTSHWSRDADAQWKDNVLVTRNLVQAALKKKVKRFIFTSTGATCGYDNLNYPETEQIKNNYVRTKRQSELEVYEGVLQGLDAVILKPIIILGKYDFSSYSKIFKDLKSSPIRVAFPGKIAFCSAEDVAKAHLQAFYFGRTCEHYVLGGEYKSWKEMFSEISDILNVPRPTVMPRWLLFIASIFMEIGSFLTRRPPLLSTDLVRLLKDAPDVTISEKRKSSVELQYQSRPLKEMVKDTYSWLKEENLI